MGDSVHCKVVAGADVFRVWSTIGHRYRTAEMTMEQLRAYFLSRDLFRAIIDSFCPARLREIDFDARRVTEWCEEVESDYVPKSEASLSDSLRRQGQRGELARELAEVARKAVEARLAEMDLDPRIFTM